MLMMIFLIIFSILYCSFSQNLVGATHVSACDSGVTPVVDITNCDEPPCQFLLGTEIGFKMTFRSPSYLEHAAPKVIATALGIPVDYPLDQKDMCEGVVNTPCPLAENELIEYEFAMTLLEIFPEISLSLKFGIVDHDKNDEMVVCFNVEAQTIRG